MEHYDDIEKQEEKSSKKWNQEKRVKLSRQEVDEKLSPGENVHTFISGGFTLVGCDVGRSELLDDAEKYGAELAGEQATKMKHGIVIMKDPPVFCETK